MKIFTLIFNLIIISKIICEEPPEYEVNENSISYFDKSNIETIIFKDYENIINSNVSNDYIILFTIREYEDLEQMLKILEESLELFKKNNTNITFYKIDMIASYDITILFNFDESPVIIYISNGKYSVYPHKRISALEIQNFIEDKNKVMINLPKDVNFIYLIWKLIKLIIYNFPIKSLFLDKIFNLLLMVVLIILIFIFVLIAIKICCLKSKANKKSNNEHHLHHQHHHHHHSNKNVIKKRHKIKVE